MGEEPEAGGTVSRMAVGTAGSMAKEKKISVENRTGTPGSPMTPLRLLLQRPPSRKSRRKIIKK
jgi:hypothetical protein